MRLHALSPLAVVVALILQLPAAAAHKDAKAAEGFNKQGIACFDKKKYRLSLRLFSKAIDLDATNPSYFLNRAQVFLKLNQIQNVVKNCDRAIALCPDDPYLLQVRADAFLKLGRDHQAIQDCNKAIGLDQTNAGEPLYYTRAQAYTRTVQHRLAIDDYSKIIELDERLASRMDKQLLGGVLLSRALEYQALGYYIEAISDLDKAVALNSKDLTALAVRSLVKCDSEQYEEALKDTERAEHLVGRTFAIHSIYAWIYACKKQHWLAERELNQAFSLWAEFNPEERKLNAFLLNVCALAYLRMGKFNHSLDLLQSPNQKLLSRDQSAINFASRSFNEKQLNLHLKAKADSLTANKLDPDNVLVQRLLQEKIEVSSEPFDLMLVSFVLSALLPSLLWLWWFWRHDKKREPAAPLFRSFLFGALLTIPIIVFATSARMFLPVIFYMCLVGPLVEEVGKFLACKLAVDRDPAFDEPVDGIIYAAATALGFAFAENLEYFATMDTMTILGRSVVSVPSHVLFSVWWGEAWSRSKFSAGTRRYSIVQGLLMAALLHALHNSLLFMASTNSAYWWGTIPFTLVLWAFFLCIVRRTKATTDSAVFRTIKVKTEVEANLKTQAR